MTGLARFQKILLAALAGMLLLFGVLMLALRQFPGAAFEEGFLRVSEAAGQTVYSGRVHGLAVTITVEQKPELSQTAVAFSIPGVAEDSCLVEYPLPPVQTESGEQVDGIRVTKNGSVLFEGAYKPDSSYGLSWYDLDGSWNPQPAFRTVYGDDFWRGYETNAYAITRFALGPEPAYHGDTFTFGLAVFFSALLAIDIIFYRELFRWKHRWARDPEPTESFLAIQRVIWVVFTAVIGIAYIAALFQIE